MIKFINFFINAMKNWKDSTSARQKLQHTYLVAGIVLLFIAGIAGLVRDSAGKSLLFFAYVSFAMFLANAVVWALLQSLVLMPLNHADDVDEESLPEEEDDNRTSKAKTKTRAKKSSKAKK